MKKKICFISASDLYLVPYINQYTKDLSIDEYDIIYWSTAKDEEVEKNHSVFYSKKGKNILSKLIKYLKFRKYIKNKIIEKDYGKIVFLHSFVGIFLYKFWIKNFKGNYIYDIRDYTFENIYIYRRIQNKLIENSGINVISSEGYKEFLPSNNYLISHNIIDIREDIRKKFKVKNSAYPIRISFIGAIRFYEILEKFILALKDDKRFIINIIGKGAKHLEDFLSKNKIYNVKIIDYFEPKETLKYYEQTDLIYNLYGNNTPLLDYALSNKLYYSANLYIPILVCSKTFMEKIGNEYGVSITVDLESENIGDQIMNGYLKVKTNKFHENCDTFIIKTSKEMATFHNRISDFYRNYNT